MTAANPTDAQASDFRITTIFRIGDWAVMHTQTAWRSEYSVATQSATPGEVFWSGGYSSLRELLASYSREIRYRIREAIDADAKSMAEDPTAESWERSEIEVRRHEMDRSEAEESRLARSVQDVRKQVHDVPGIYEPIHWDSIPSAEFRTARAVVVS